jgi:tetratricopeptide (TPR) repeat protein
LLSSFLLEAKLEGFVTLRADPGNVEADFFGVARAMLRQLTLAEPSVLRDAVRPHEELLAPLLACGPAATLPEPDEDSSSALVDALAAVLGAVAEARPTIVCVDDFERVDVHSKQLLIRLAKASRKSTLMLVVALVQDAATEAHLLLRELSSAIALSPLSAPETGQLMCSLFGEIAHVEVIGKWVHRLSSGNPRTALEAATHLVDSKIARFEEGSWVLPGSLEDLQLPASIDQTLDAKIAMLGSDARRLCAALAVSSEVDPLQADEYGALVDGISGARLDAAISELVARSIVVSTPPSVAFSHEGLRDAAKRSIAAAEFTDLHRRVAAAYRSGAAPSLVLSAYHSLEAGDVELAFTHGARAVHRRATITMRGSAFLRSEEGSRAFERLFEWGLSRKNPPWPKVLTIGQVLLQNAAVGDMALVRHRDPVIARLRVDSGRADWEELGELHDPIERIQTAVGRAFARYESTPEHERGLPPLEAIEALCGAVAGLSGVFARRSEINEVVALLPLIEPFRIMSPAVAGVVDMLQFIVDAILGRSVREPRLRLLRDLSAPVAGLEEVTRVGIYWLNLYYQALDDAVHGRPDAAELASPLLQTATYAPLTWEARMVAALFQGDLEGADVARRERDLSRLARSPEIDAQLEGGFPYEAAAYDMLGDVLRLKRCLPWFEERARICPQGRPRYEMHLGNYHRLRGENQKALAAYERALALVPGPAAHGDFAYIAMRCTQALVDVGRPADARDLSARAVAEGDAFGIIRSTRHLLAMKLAVAEAALGLAEAAAERSERIIEEATSEELRGIFFVNLCRDQAQVAQLCRSEALLERAVVRLEQLAAHSRYPAFATKHAHLLRHAQGRGRFQVAPNPQKALGGGDATHTSMVVGVRTQIERCRGRDERARRALQILLDTAASEEGFLYVFGQNGMTLAASSTEKGPPGSLERSLAERIRSGAVEEDTTDETTQMRSLRPADPQNTFDVVEVISEKNGRCVLAALAALKPKNEILSPIPMTVRAALSDALIKAGDTAAIPWA